MLSQGVQRRVSQCLTQQQRLLGIGAAVGKQQRGQQQSTAAAAAAAATAAAAARRCVLSVSSQQRNNNSTIAHRLHCRRRDFSFRAALCHSRMFASGGGTYHDDRGGDCRTNTNRNRNNALLLANSAIPRTALDASVARRCFFSTSVTSDELRSDGGGGDNDDDRSTDSNNNNKGNDRKGGLLRKRATDMRHKATSKAALFRDSAQGHYRDFREDPSQSARTGAKSFGNMLRLYGPVFVGTYGAVYFGTLGFLFTCVESGVLDPVTLFDWLGHGGAESAGETKSTVDYVVQFMENHALTKPYAHIIEKKPEVANLAVAWIAVKFTEPVRLAVSMAVTPRVARYFGFSPRIDAAVVPPPTDAEQDSDGDGAFRDATSVSKEDAGANAASASNKETDGTRKS